VRRALMISQAVDLVRRYKEVGAQLFIPSFWRNDRESMELFASEVMPHFA
jgi:hypothetical protein